MKTILLVDDEYALLENLAELLRGEGYRVVTAAHGKDALARLQQEKPDLVVTDFMMPIADGRDLIRGMRALAEFRSIPVVMMSATIRAVALPDEGDALDVSEFLKKPFRWQKLRDAVLRLLGPPDASGPDA